MPPPPPPPPPPLLPPFPSFSTALMSTPPPPPRPNPPLDASSTTSNSPTHSTPSDASLESDDVKAPSVNVIENAPRVAMRTDSSSVSASSSDEEEEEGEEDGEMSASETYYQDVGEVRRDSCDWGDCVGRVDVERTYGSDEGDGEREGIQIGEEEGVVEVGKGTNVTFVEGVEVLNKGKRDIRGNVHGHVRSEKVAVLEEVESQPQGALGSLKRKGDEEVRMEEVESPTRGKVEVLEDFCEQTRRNFEVLGDIDSHSRTSGDLGLLVDSHSRPQGKVEFLDDVERDVPGGIVDELEQEGTRRRPVGEVCVGYVEELGDVEKEEGRAQVEREVAALLQGEGTVGYYHRRNYSDWCEVADDALSLEELQLEADQVTMAIENMEEKTDLVREVPFAKTGRGGCARVKGLANRIRNVVEGLAEVQMITAGKAADAQEMEGGDHGLKGEVAKLMITLDHLARLTLAEAQGVMDFADSHR